MLKKLNNVILFYIVLLLFAGSLMVSAGAYFFPIHTTLSQEQLEELRQTGARTGDNWGVNGSYIFQQDNKNILIKGTNKYLNFGSISGSTGYGFRDNGGDMEYKDSGGSWTAFNSISGSGAVSGDGVWATSTYGTYVYPISEYDVRLDSNSSFYASTSEIMTLNVYGTFTPPTGYILPALASTTNWQSAYDWGDHALAGYLTSESDPIWLASSSDYMLLSVWYSTTTDALDEGSTNLYYTDQRVADYLLGSSTLQFANVNVSGDLVVTNHIDFNTASGSSQVLDELCFSSGECMTSPTNVGSQLELFHWNATASVATYEQLRIVPDGMDDNIDESCSADADLAGGYCDIDNYVSTTTELALTSIPAGVWAFHYYTYVSSVANTSKIEATVYKRAAGGTETILFQATSTEIDAISTSEYQFETTQSAFEFTTTDRLVVKVRGWTDSTSAKSIHFLYGGNTTNYSHIVTPITFGNFNFARLDVANTITADWVNTAYPWSDNEVSDTLTCSTVSDADKGDITISSGVWSVEDDSHNHVYSNIDAFTEANLYTLLTDVTQFYEAGDEDTIAGLFSAGAYANDSVLNEDIDDDGNFAFTGTWDFGSGVLEIPNGTNPTCNDPGEICHDTTDNMLIVDDRVIPTDDVDIWKTCVASTSLSFITEGFHPVPVEANGYTMGHIECYVIGGTSKTLAIEDTSSNSTEDLVCATTVTDDDGSITNAAVNASEIMRIDMGATSGAVDYVCVSVFGYWTRE